MREGEVSRTALHVAAARAAHLRYDPPPHLLGDVFAERLLGAAADELVASYADDASGAGGSADAAGARWLLLENRLFIPFRARFGEDVIAEACARGVAQVVVLGAGLDSFALRHPAALGALAVFEVDHPATQAWKRARLAELGASEPDGLRFVACDFERTAVSDALRAAGLRTDAPAVVTWMGVVYYLSRETVASALADLRSVLAPGSAVALDYQLPVGSLSQRYRDVFASVASYLRDTGEPQVNRYRPDEMRAAILAAGFASAELPTRAELYARYFAPLRSRIPMSERFGLAVARA